MQATVDTTASVTNRAREVLKEMAQWGISPSPENYHVWYERLGGENSELSDAVTLLIEREASFSAEVMNDLYQRHIVPEQETAVLQQAQAQTHSVLKEVLDDFLSVGDSASEYGDKLATFSTQLKATHGESDLRRVIKEILDDTARMSDASLDLEENLKEAITQSRILQERLEQAESEMLRDHLTGLNNRKAYEAVLTDLLGAFEEEGTPFSVIALDIDHFKQFNDTFGHSVGDAVIRKVALTLQENLKGFDFPARVGGEEFTVLLPGTKLENALVVANNIRESLRTKKLKVVGTDLDLGTVTASFGAAEVCGNDTDASLIERADRAMYLAKESGRDTVRSELNL